MKSCGVPLDRLQLKVSITLHTTPSENPRMFYPLPTLVLSPDVAFSEERAPEQGRISRYMKVFKGYGHFLGRRMIRLTLIFLLTTLLSPLSGKGELTFRRFLCSTLIRR